MQHDMRRLITLIEAFHTAFMQDGNMVEVFENPSRGEFLKLIAASEHGVLRAWLYDRILLVWDASLSTHDVDFDLPDPGDGRVDSLVLSRAGVIINHLSYVLSGYEPGNELTPKEQQYVESYIGRLKQHPLLQRIYGSNVTVKIIDFDSDPEIANGDDRSQIAALRKKL